MASELKPFNIYCVQKFKLFKSLSVLQSLKIIATKFHVPRNVCVRRVNKHVQFCLLIISGFFLLNVFLEICRK